MKRMLSVFLSLVMLVSALVIPMSVSAAPTEEEKTAAFNAVVDAVKNLKLDLNNVSTIEYANPTASAGGSDNSGKITLSDVSAVAEKAILGDKKVQINGDNKVTSEKTPGGLVADHLHAISYQPISNVYVHLYKVGYFVIYVKTARPFKLSLGAANVQTQNINFLNGENAIDVPATGDGYTPVVINIQSGIDWTKSVLNGNNAKRLYAAEYVFSNLYASVQEMTEGDNAITAADGITFGSAFYVPVDETVRDFRYNVTTSKSPSSTDSVKYRFTELSAEMIAAAEAIDNTHGNYTAASFAILQNAIKTAKEVFLDDGGNAVDLFKAEVNNLYKLEEVCRPTSFGGKMDGIPYANASEITINGKPLSDKQKEYFGDCLVKVDSTTNSTNVVRLTDKTTTGAVPGMGQLVKKYKDYKNLYLAVANTGDVYKDTQLTSYNQYYTAVNYITRQDSSYKRQLILKNGCNLISLYDLIVNSEPMKTTKDSTVVTNVFRENNVLFYSDVVMNSTIEEYTTFWTRNGNVNQNEVNFKNYNDGFNVLNFVSKTLAEGTSLYIGSLMGEVAFDTTGLEEVTTKGKAIKYYNEKIAGKGYINTDDIDGTLSALGIFKLSVTGLYKSEDIEFTSDYTFDAVISGEELAFKVNNVPADVTVSVTYGGETVDKDVNDEYKFTVADAEKQLVINLSHITNEFFSESNATSFDEYYLGDTNNLVHGKDAVVFTSYNYDSANGRYNDRKQSQSFYTNNFTDGSYAGTDTRNSSCSTAVNYYVSTDSETGEITCRNGYVTYAKDSEGNPPAEFDFDRSQDGDQPFECYTDIIYDLGHVADVNKLQHIGWGGGNADLSLGAYQIYASENIEDLFNKEKGSLVLNYQNKTLVTKEKIFNGQIHEFPTKRARFVAIRVYCPFTKFRSSGNSSTLYISEIGIYGTVPEGTKVPDYKISSGKFGDLWIGGNETNVSTPSGTESLLNSQNATVYAKNGTTEFNFEGLDLTNLNDLKYLACGKYVEFTGFNFYNGKTLKNGYHITRDNAGYISFTQDENPNIDTYLDLTYDLNGYYNVKEFLFCEQPGGIRTQAYKLYIGNDKDSLYEEDNVVVYYENLFNCGGQIITFDSPKPGKYLGVRVLLNTPNPGSSEPIRLSEVAAFGTAVGAPADTNLKPAELSARSVFVYDYNNSSIYKKDGVDCTALRLSVGYSSPAKADGSADAGKIVLKDNTVANVIERNVIVMSKAKYDTLISGGGTFDINTSAARYSTVQGEKLNQYFKAEDLTIDTADNAKFKVFGTYKFHGITQDLKDKEIVVLGRVVYELDGKCYLVYTDVAGTEDGKTISPQSAYDALKSQEGKDQQGWFETVNNQ